MDGHGSGDQMAGVLGVKWRGWRAMVGSQLVVFSSMRLIVRVGACLGSLGVRSSNRVRNALDWESVVCVGESSVTK